MKNALKTTASFLLLALTAPVWIVALIILAGAYNHNRYYDIDLEDNMAKLVKPRGDYDSCAFCLHRSECWGGEAYSDAGGGKKPYPSTVKCTVRFKFDKRFNAYA